MKMDAKFSADKVQLAARLGASVHTGGGAQANWAQNDETAADYVKNRPGGYYGDPVETEVEEYSGILKNAEIGDPPFTLVAGNTYKVTIDGATQQYVAFADEVEGMPCATIGTAAIEEALGSENGWAIAYAEITVGSETDRLALITGTGEFNGKAFAFLGTKLTREVYKIPLALLELPPEKKQIFTVEVGAHTEGSRYESSARLADIHRAVQSGLSVVLRYNSRFCELTGLESERAYFHGFDGTTLLWAAHETGYIVDLSTYNIGKNELTYSASSTYTSLFGGKSFPCGFSSVWTRMKFFITLRLLTRTAGAYVQLRYDKGKKILNICKHEEIGTDKAILCGELEKTSTGNYTYLVTLRLRSEDGTLHPARFDFCDELNLDGGDTYSSPRIEILSGTEDKFAARQSVRQYGR